MGWRSPLACHSGWSRRKAKVAASVSITTVRLPLPLAVTVHDAALPLATLLRR